MDLATVLRNAQAPNQEIRRQAEAFLNQAIDAQYGEFLLALATELAAEGKEPSSRQLAGLYIKNLISAQDEAILNAKVNKWLQCAPHLKDSIRAALLQAVSSPVQVVAHTSAQALAAFGAVDVPRNEWPSLLHALFHNISSPDVQEGCKTASLEALGYMCEVMDPEKVESNVVNQILNSIVDGMRADRRADIRLAAVKALNNSLDFTGQNFEVVGERDAIMRAICEATQANDVKIRETAFECAATVANLYYDKLQAYIETLFNLSTNAIRNDDPAVGMQAIEFWNTICDEEIDIIQDHEDGETSRAILYLVKAAAPALVPLVLECMTKQDEDADEDTWNISMAAATLLEAMALTIGDDIVDKVLPFVTQNINNPNWRLKESALMAFGMILDGPSADKLSPLVAQAMPIIVQYLGDGKALVRDTAAWVIGKICELHQSCLTGDILPAVVNGLSVALEDKEGKVVSQACYALHNLAAACEDQSEDQSNVLSHFMPTVLQKLLVITSKTEWETDNVRTSAYEAMNMMVENCALDMHNVVASLLVETLNRLEFTFSPQFNLPERMNVQSSLCSLIAQSLRKLELHEFESLSDRVVQLLLQVFSTKGAIAHEDAFLALGFLAEKLKDKFQRYLGAVQGPLVMGLRNVEEYQVCTAAVGALGDACRAVSRAILPICDDVVRCLLELLQSSVLNRSVKPHVISVFADIAMAIEGDFERYANVVLGILHQAGEVTINTDDEDMIEYINSLRNSILEAYTGILQGMKDANRQEAIAPALQSIAEFIQRCSEDPHRSDEVVKSAVGLLGDLGQCFGTRMATLYRQPFVQPLVTYALTGNINCEEVANWTHSIISGVLRSSGR